MLVCINGKWKIPICTYFINDLSGQEKKNIVHDVLTALDGTGVTVVGLTSDAPKSNFTIYNLLGADLKVQGTNKYYFNHPTTKQKIYLMLDACHSLKNIRNSFAKTDQLMYDSEGRVIHFEFIRRLIAISEIHNELVPAHKLTLDHLMWFENKMNVGIAAQTLSKSVSTALTRLHHIK